MAKKHSLKFALEREKASSKKRKLENNAEERATKKPKLFKNESSKRQIRNQGQQANQQPVVPFVRGESILLIGEGDFTFTLALLSYLSQAQDRGITQGEDGEGGVVIATTLDSLQLSKEKYPSVEENIKAIEGLGGVCIFGVDATNLGSCKQLKRKSGWDKIVFNFPHSGSSIADQDRNIRTNQSLILLFLRSAAPLLRVNTSKLLRRTPSPGSDDEESTIKTKEIFPEPCILITLFTGSPYNLWALPDLAKNKRSMASTILQTPLNRGKQPVYDIRKSFRFPRQVWAEKGYAHQRTNPTLKSGFKKEKVGGGEGEARTWMLVLKESEDEKSD